LVVSAGSPCLEARASALTPAMEKIWCGWCRSHRALTHGGDAIPRRLGSRSGKGQWRTAGLVPNVDAMMGGGFSGKVGVAEAISMVGV
jgi:hypothetical protein